MRHHKDETTLPQSQMRMAHMAKAVGSEMCSRSNFLLVEQILRRRCGISGLQFESSHAVSRLQAWGAFIGCP